MAKFIETETGDFINSEYIVSIVKEGATVSVLVSGDVFPKPIRTFSTPEAAAQGIRDIVYRLTESPTTGYTI